MEPTGPLKTLFVNVSHLYYCLALLVIATVQWRFHRDVGLPPWLATAVGCLLAGLTLCLMVWDAVDGFRRLVADKHWLSVVLLAGIYLSVAILAIHAFPALVVRE
jgi:hypothetical protein